MKGNEVFEGAACSFTIQILPVDGFFNILFFVMFE